MDQMDLNKFKAWAMQPGLETFPANSEEIMWAIDKIERLQKDAADTDSFVNALADIRDIFPYGDTMCESGAIGNPLDVPKFVKGQIKGLIQDAADVAQALAPIGCNPIMPMAPQVKAVVEELLQARQIIKKAAAETQKLRVMLDQLGGDE